MKDVQGMWKEVQESNVFQQFDSTGYVLAHVFFTEKLGLEFGCYDEKNDKIVVFETNPVTMRPPEDVFKESGKLKALDMDKVAVGLHDARTLATAYLEEHYPQHPIQQEILVLQQAEHPVWNCTLVTKTLNMLNLKIDARSGDILHVGLHNIMDLRKD